MNKWRYAYKAIGMLWIWLWAFAASAQGSQLNAVRVESEANKVQLILTLTQATSYKIFSLANPSRLVADLQHTQLATNLNFPANSAIQSVRSSMRADGTLRIVFDLNQALHPRGVTLQPQTTAGSNLIVELQNNAKLIPTANVKKPAVAQSSQGVTASLEMLNETIPNSVVPKRTLPLVANVKSEIVIKPGTGSNLEVSTAPTKASMAEIAAKVSTTSIVTKNDDEEIKSDDPIASFSDKKVKEILPPANSGRDIIVVIDPGHGGKDPGAMGFRGTHEKDVVLAISKNLQKQINKQPGMHAVLTRDDDYFIPLRERLDIARKDKADMFVAVHADAFSNPYSFGTSVFALSERGASSEAARWLAEKENYSELGGVNLDDKDNILRSVLIDLSQSYTIGASLQLGSSVLQQLGKMTRLHRGRVEQARFVVLKSPDIPSILVETGFLSNPSEEAKLRSEQYQEELALALMAGIRHYFWNNPPTGTQLAAQRAAVSRYVAVAGDTLPVVAKRYSVSVRALKKYNQLTSNALREGQVLRIPSVKDS